MKKRLLVISYFCMIIGTILFIATLILQSANSQELLNIKRFRDNGVRVKAVVVEKKIVDSEFIGTFGISRKTTQHRIYVSEGKNLKKMYWQSVTPEIYNQIEPGNSLEVFINRDEMMIADLVEGSNTLSALLMLAATMLYVVAILSYKKSARFHISNP